LFFHDCLSSFFGFVLVLPTELFLVLTMIIEIREYVKGESLSCRTQIIVPVRSFSESANRKINDFAENKIVRLLGLDWQIQTTTVGFTNPTGAIGSIIFFEMPKNIGKIQI